MTGEPAPGLDRPALRGLRGGDPRRPRPAAGGRCQGRAGHPRHRALRPHAEAEPADIAAHIAAQAAPFMVPRHIRLVEALPLTPTEKVIEAGLPRALDAQTWTRPEDARGG